mgnify:FL=1
MASIEVKNISKIFDNKLVLNNLNFNVSDGELLSILGKSGCGKTTLLKILIGIEKPSSGSILKNNKNITKYDISKRGMGIVFQNYALFPNMTVLENVSYALKNKLKDKKKAYKQAMDVISMVNLEDHINKYPDELSGGQMQRVAIARTLALKPDVILFDEALSALDAENKIILRNKIRELNKKFNITMIFITHDQEEAFSISDRVMIMNDGCIEQIDKPSEIFKHPASKYVEDFVVKQLKEKITSIQKCVKVDIWWKKVK